MSIPITSRFLESETSIALLKEGGGNLTPASPTTLRKLSP